MNTDNTLYIKVNKKYKPWGTLGRDYMSLPYGLWLITHTDGSSGCKNLSMMLADEQEIVNTKVILDRIQLHEQILETILQVSQKGSYSFDELATKIAVALTPAPNLNLRK